MYLSQMTLQQKIIAARKKKGLTQENVAELTNVTVRTIQRIENGDSTPRAYTLKAIASALDIPLDELSAVEAETGSENPALQTPTAQSSRDDLYFLHLLNLSCFSYLVIPFVHFLIPMYLLSKRKEIDEEIRASGRRIIKIQIYWLILTHVLLLLTLAINILQTSYLTNPYLIHLLWPLGIMFTLNACILIYSASSLKKEVLLAATASIAP